MLKKQLGDQGEQIAAKYLKKQGYKILDHNFRCKMGEIDVIARQGEYIVFVEVRSKSSIKYGLPIESVDHKKQSKIKLVAQYYLIHHRLNDCLCRFDVVSIIWHEGNSYEIAIFQDAFQ